MSTQGKDLTKEAPLSPGHRTGGYIILSRLADKARAAFLGGNPGEYHTNCALDQNLLSWKGVTYDELKAAILDGASDQELAAYLDAHGTPKTPQEVEAWSNAVSRWNPSTDPKMADWFKGETARVGLDPATASLFTFLEVDDQVSLRK